MQEYKVKLEVFEGPLDLLLYLIRKQNFNILDIPMAPLTRQYLEYVEVMRTRNLELAAEYLLMAALLKLGALPPAADPDNPTPEEVSATTRALAAYQAIFDTH